MAIVAQQPPEPGGDGTTGIISGNDQGRATNPPAREQRHQGRGVGQRVAAAARSGWPGEITVQVGVPGAGDVTRAVGLFA